MTDLEREPKAEGRSPLVWGWLGAMSVGLYEVARVAFVSRLDAGPIALLVLILAACVVPGLLGALVAGLAALLPRVRVSGRPAWVALGVLSAAVASFATTWFAAPGPFHPPLPLQGNPVVFAVAALVVLAAVGLAWSRMSRLQQGVAAAALSALAVFSLWYGRPPPPVPAPKGAPDVLLITVDGFRADRLGVDVAPVTAGVGSEGAVFARAHAQVPYTGPSHVTLLTGSAPWDHQVMLDGAALPDGRPTLAEVLRDAGWETGAFVSGHALSGALGFDRGFRVYDDDFAWAKGARHVLAGRLFSLASGGRQAGPAERRAEATVSRALHWLEVRRDPWFAWVNLGDPRAPWQPPQPWDARFYQGTDPQDPRGSVLPDDAVPSWAGKSAKTITDPDWLVAQYDGEVGYADAQVQRLLDWVDERGRPDDTLVVITAPHGVTVGERGRWFVHDGVSDGEVHVPLVVRAPGVLDPGVVVQEPVELTDVAPGIVSWAGLDVPREWTGVPLTGAVEQRTAARSLARSVAFDSARIHREDQPAWRVVTVRNRDETYTHYEAPGALDAFTGEGAAAGLLRDLMAERARDLVRASAADQLEVPELSQADHTLLHSLGWTTSPE